ncbi:hypothetical protein pb186bvf_001868 [Paramecium bursaria]
MISNISQSQMSYKKSNTGQKTFHFRCVQHHKQEKSLIKSQNLFLSIKQQFYLKMFNILLQNFNSNLFFQYQIISLEFNSFTFMINLIAYIHFESSSLYQYWVNQTFTKDEDEEINQDKAKYRFIPFKTIKQTSPKLDYFFQPYIQFFNLEFQMRIFIYIKRFLIQRNFSISKFCNQFFQQLNIVQKLMLKLTIITIFYQLIVVYTQKIYSLEENLICEIKPCDKEIQQQFGDLTGIPFTLTFFYHPNGQSASFIASIQEGASPIVTLTQSAGYSFRIQNTGTKTSQQFNLNVWYQVIITEQIIKVCNHLACYLTPHNKTITQNTKLNILNSSSTQFNYIKACCIVMYKGITYPNPNQISFYNTKYPEVVVNLNIQEKTQSNITVDYSDYQYIAKLGDIFDYDQYDPYLIDDSLLFNSSQYIQINQITLNDQFTFEFRFKQSATFTSNIMLLNYTFPSTNSQIYIFLNGSKITYKVNNQNVQFQLLTSDYTHFCLGVIQYLEQSANLQQLNLIQFSDTQTLQILTQNISGYILSNHGFGYMSIGSKQNQFQSGEYFDLFIFRYYQGFFYDDQQVMVPNCKIYLNDRCNICNAGYILQDDHSCVLVSQSCDKTNYDTVLVPSHNQCIRRCHQKCATCSLADPQICLSCNSIRTSPPNCNCPNQYFEDQVSPKCRKYYPDVTVQTGYAVANCGYLTSYAGYTSSLIVFFQQTYQTIPKMIISSLGQSFSFTQQDYLTYYSISSITISQFQINFYCDVDYQIYMFNWISSIGNNILYPQVFYSNFGSFAYSYNLNQAVVIFNNSTINPLYQIHGWEFYSTNTKFQVKQQILSPTQIKIYSNQYFYYYQYYNYVYVLYKTYNISSSTLDTQLDDQPKSIKQFIFQRGFYVDSLTKYRLTTNNTRNSSYFKIKQQYNQSMEIYDWLLILASQQCNNNTGPCDFYDSYTSNCNLQLQFCAYKLESSNFFINSQFKYQLCDANCRTCFGTSTNCTSCYTDFFTLPQNITQNTKFCSQICDKTCLTCSTTNNTLCLSCSQFATLISTQCKCNSGYYFDNDDTKLCQKCSKKCATCKNDDKYYCLSCNSLTILTETTCQCPQGKYYDENYECQKCLTICKTCMNSLSCTNCIDSLQLLEQGQCYCPNNYYTDNTYNCQHCQLPCENCLDQSTCLSCPADKVLLNFKCVCESSKYLDQNGYCQDCNQLCNTCNGPQDNQCLSCNSVRILSQQNQCLCYKGYYSQDNECLKCSYYCAECQQETKCLACPYNRYLNDFNICICSQGYYNKENQQSCESCANNCESCLNFSKCLKCKINQTLQDGQCFCSKGFFEESGLCLSCDSKLGKFQKSCNYKNCNDNIWTPSEECDDGNKINNDGCTNCIIDKNYQCFNRMKQTSICYQCQNNCRVCSYSQNMIKCNFCNEGYYLYNNQCLKCDKYCKTCSSFSNCTTCLFENKQPDEFQRCSRCDEGFYEQKDQCVSQCGDGIKTDGEQCDDGNNSSSDGCSNLCHIEDSFICNIYQGKSSCFQSEKPKLNINKIIKLTQSQYVINIISTQEINYSKLDVLLVLKNENSYIFSYEVYSTSNNESKFSILQMNITINFTISFQKEIFIIKINGNISNRYEQSISQTQLEQEFQNIQILSELQQSVSQQGSDIANKVFYLTVALTVLQLIISGSSSVSLMLRTQNYLQYMRFIKIDYPPNIAILFQQFADSNILQYLDFSYILNGIFGVGFNYNSQITNNKVHQLNSQEVNTSFIINLMPFILTFVQSLIIIKITQLVVYLVNQIILYRHQGQKNFLMKIYKVLSFGQFYALKSIYEFKKTGIKEILLISQYSISFAFFIKLKTFDYNSYLDCAELIITLGVSYICVNYLIESSKNQQGKITLLRLINGIQYLFCIVFLDNLQLEQMLLISLQSIMMLILLLQKYPLQNMQNIVEEFSFLITFLSSILFGSVSSNLELL